MANVITRCAVAIAIVLSTCAIAGCSSRVEVASDVPEETETPRAASPSSAAPAVPSSRAAFEPTASASVAAAPPATVAPLAPASPTDVFAAKIALLDKVDDAVMSGKPDALAALAIPETALAGCSQTGRDRARSSLEVSEECVVSARDSARRVAINVGDDENELDPTCDLATLEKSELFYRLNGRTLKLTVHAVAVGKEVYLKRLHCHRSQRTAKDVNLQT